MPAAAATDAAGPQPQPADDSEEWAELCDPDRMDQLLDGTTRLLELSTQSLELIDKNQELIMQLYERASATESLLCLSATETVPHSGCTSIAMGIWQCKGRCPSDQIYTPADAAHRCSPCGQAPSGMPPAAASKSWSCFSAVTLHDPWVVRIACRSTPGASGRGPC